MDEKDRSYFQGLLEKMLRKHFKEEDFSKVAPTTILFADFLAGERSMMRQYTEVTDLEMLRSLLHEYMEDYNVVHSPSLHLVFFDYAVEHCLKICRIIKQPFGNALLLGLPGSGRECLTKLASFICDRAVFQVDIKQSYGVLEWKEDLKQLVKIAGI